MIFAVVIWLVVRGPSSGPPSIAPNLKTETVLVVGPESGDCRTLAEAIEKAKSENTTIKVRLAEIAEQLDLRDSRLPKGLPTYQSAWKNCRRP